MVKGKQSNECMYLIKLDKLSNCTHTSLREHINAASNDNRCILHIWDIIIYRGLRYGVHIRYKNTRGNMTRLYQSTWLYTYMICITIFKSIACMIVLQLCD